MPELNHLLPMDMHTENNKERYEVRHDNVGVEE